MTHMQQQQQQQQAIEQQQQADAAAVEAGSSGGSSGSSGSSAASASDDHLTMLTSTRQDHAHARMMTTQHCGGTWCGEREALQRGDSIAATQKESTVRQAQKVRCRVIGCSIHFPLLLHTFPPLLP